MPAVPKLLASGVLLLFGRLVFCVAGGMADNEDLGLGSEEHLDGLDENGVNEDGLLNDGDPELEAIKARVREMEEEAEKLKQLQSDVDKQMNMGSPPGFSKSSLLAL